MLPYRYRRESTLPEHVREQRRFLDDELELQSAKPVRASATSILWMPAIRLRLVPRLRERVVHPGGLRAAAGVLGALHAVSHQLIRVVNHSYINATSVCDLLRAVAAAVWGRPITLVLDNARYQNGPGPGVGPILENPSAVPAFLRT